MGNDVQIGKPKVSVIVPVYNVEKYIHQCVDSILRQTMGDIEIILVDDGSADGCPEICDEYGKMDNRVKVIHQKNAGVSSARNRGIEIATGQYVYFVDSDDWIEEDGLKQLYETAQSAKADVVFADCYERYEYIGTKRICLYSRDFNSSDRDFILQIQKSVLCHKFSPCFSAGADSAYPAPWSKLIRLGLIKEKEIKFDPYVQGIYDDGLFTMEVLEYAKKILYSGICAYNYRILNSSLVHTYKSDMIARFERNCERMDDFIVKYDKGDDFAQAEYGRRIAYLSSFLTSYFFNSENPHGLEEVERELRQLLSKDPWRVAIDNVKYHNLELKHQYTLWCMRAECINGLKLYSFTKKKLKRKSES